MWSQDIVSLNATGRHGSGGSAGHSLDSGQNVQQNENPIDVNLRVIGAPAAHLCPVGFSGREDNYNAFSRLHTLTISAKYLITENSKLSAQIWRGLTAPLTLIKYCRCRRNLKSGMPQSHIVVELSQNCNRKKWEMLQNTTKQTNNKKKWLPAPSAPEPALPCHIHSWSCSSPLIGPWFFVRILLNSGREQPWQQQQQQLKVMLTDKRVNTHAKRFSRVLTYTDGHMATLNTSGFYSGYAF